MHPSVAAVAHYFIDFIGVAVILFVIAFVGALIVDAVEARRRNKDAH